MATTYEQFRAMVLALPGVEERPSYGGRPSFRVRKQFLVWLREPDTLAMRTVDLVHKQFLLETQPDVFWTTSHYDGYPAVLIRLSAVEPAQLQELLQETWRSRAGKTLIASYEASPTGAPGSQD